MPPDNRSTRAYRAVAPIDEEDIHPGAVVGNGRFEILGLLGSSPASTLFRARDLRSDRNKEIALKVIARKLVGDTATEQRFANETRLAGRLHGHRNVVAPLEHGRLDDRGGRVFLVNELVGGPSLSDLIAMHGPLKVDDACTYMRDVARALRDLHQGGVVHRNVKPDNVLIVGGKQGRVAKLLDFGLAADVGVGSGDRNTQPGQRAGTAHYMSPEQAWDAPAHPVFDIYSLGVTFYEVLTGHPPFFELDEAQVIARKCDLEQPAPSIIGRRNDLPPRLEVLVDQCLQPVAKKRVPSINAFLKRLDSITDGVPGGVSPRKRQETSMVGQARTVGGQKARKSRLPEILAQAAAQKQQPAFVPDPSISPEAPTPDPDRVGRALPQQHAAAHQAIPPQHVAGAGMQAPMGQGHAPMGHGHAVPGHHAPMQAPPSGSNPYGSNPAYPGGMPAGYGTGPYGAAASQSGRPMAGPASGGHARSSGTSKAMVAVIVFGAFLLTMLVVGLWLWASRS